MISSGVVPFHTDAVGEPAQAPFRRCVRCVMDDLSCDTVFDDDGICNYCREFVARFPEGRFDNIEAHDRVIKDMKLRGAGRPYDCVIGMSGGVDSTYVAYLMRRRGLRPLAVHLDNGWNSEIAAHNIERAVKKLEIDLVTVVLNWNEFRELQLAFLRASVPDAEIPTDHAIFATIHEVARRHRVPYLVDGQNVATEGIHPGCWTYGTWDWRYIKDVNRQFGTRRLRTFPRRRLTRVLFDHATGAVTHFSPLSHQTYDKKEAMSILERDLGWQYYGGKHHESIYTRFFQGYILPTKFGIDKRKSHLSTMICSGQISREEAVAELAKPTYDEQLMESDRQFVIKKLRLTEAEFDALMQRPLRSFREHKTNAWFMRKAEVGEFLRRYGILKRRGLFHF